jgi:hypothetical protein
MTGFKFEIGSMEDALKEHPASINGMEPSLSIRNRLSGLLALNGIEEFSFSDYKVVTRASTMCIKQMEQQLLQDFHDKVQPGHRLYGQRQKIESQIELAFKM